MRQALTQLGESGIQLGQAMRHIFTGDVDLGDTLYQIHRTATSSFGIVMVAATFIGMALSLQIAKELVLTYGADRFVGGMISMGIVREVGPVFTAVAIVGNVGSSIAAEIGSMQVTEQIDALKVFNISPIRYLVVPRLIATCLVTPGLAVVGCAVSILAGMFVSNWAVDIPYHLFLDSAQATITMRDLSVMLLKSFLFGIAIAIIGCSFGMATKGGAEAVGTSTTQAVVWGLLAIFFINYLVTSMVLRVGVG